MGFGASFTVIPVIPEMLDSVKGKYLDQQSELSDGFSGIFNIAGGFGQIVGPTISGALYDEVGFNWTMDIFSCSILFYNILYILLCGGLDIILSLRKKKPAELGSPKRHLLIDEETSDAIGSDEEGFGKLRSNNKEIPEANNTSLSTNESFAQNDSYTIN